MKHNPFRSIKNDDPTETARRSQVFDKFSRAIAPNDIIQLTPHGTTLWRVLEIRPDLNPESPMKFGQLLTLQSMESVGVQGGMPCTDLLKVRDAAEYMKVGVDLGTDAGDQTVRAEAPVASGPRLVTES